MAKSKRPRVGIGGISKEDAMDIGKKVIEQVSEGVSAKVVKPIKKKEPSVKFNMRIPAVLNNRLEEAIETSGLSKSSIIIRGLMKELDAMEGK